MNPSLLTANVMSRASGRSLSSQQCQNSYRIGHFLDNNYNLFEARSAICLLAAEAAFVL